MLFQRVITLVLVSGMALAGHWLIAFLQCLGGRCVEDDASRMAASLLGDVLLAADVVMTLGVVFLPALVLRRWLPIPVAATIPPLAVAAAISALLFDARYDDLASSAALTSILAGPWFIASIIGLTIWRVLDQLVAEAKKA